MQYTSMTGTDLSPSAVCLGTASYGGGFDEQQSFALLDAFVEGGGNFLDTAHNYSDWVPGERSRSEKVIGRWMQARGNRQQMVIGTKGGHVDLDNNRIPRLAPELLIADVDESLKFLQTDVIDLYWLHRDDISRPVAAILETLDDQAKKGKIRYYGCSNWSNDRIREAMSYAKLHGLKGFVASQMMWSLAEPNLEAVTDKTTTIMDSDGMTLHRETGMTAIPFSSQAKGYFTKVDQPQIKPASPSLVKLYGNEINARRLEKVQRLASELSVSINEIVLSYLISQPFPTIPIAGCRSVEQVAESTRAADLKLPADVVRDLEGDL